MVQEQPGNIHMTIHGGLHQSGVHFVCLVLLVCPCIQEKLDHLQVSFVAGQRQCTLLELVGVSVDVSTKLQQQLGHTNMSTGCCLHQRGVAILVLMFNVSGVLHQDVHNILIATATCVCQGCIANAGLGIDVGSMVNEQLHNVCIATRCSFHQRGGVTFDASVLNTGSHSQQHFCQLIVASRAGQREKALSIFGGVLKPVVTLRKQPLHSLYAVVGSPLLLLLLLEEWQLLGQ